MGFIVVYGEGFALPVPTQALLVVVPSKVLIGKAQGHNEEEWFTMKHSAVTFLALVSLAVQGSLYAQPATKTVFPAQGLTTPIGIAYSPFVNKLLVTQPFCGTQSGANATGFNVTAIDSVGNSSLFANLPAVPLSTDPVSGHNTSPFNRCFENYLAVSPGLGGFPANQVYVTQGQNVVTIPAGGGGTATHFSGPLATEDTESGISFDTVGTFCNDMIVTGANGLVYLINSAGTPTLYATISATIGLPVSGKAAAESAIVAPLTFAPYGGWLLVGVESSTNGGGVAAIEPPTSCSNGIPVIPNGSPRQYRINNQPGPDGVLAVPTSAPTCEFGSGASAGSLFAITYTAPVVIPSLINPYQIVSYPAANFVGKVGDVMVNNEFIKTDVLTPAGGSLGTFVNNTLFDSGLGAPSFIQQEGLTFVGCPIKLGCVLTPGGYKNHFNYKVTPLTIGGQVYTAAQVTTIISTGGGGINALGRSLATALLNIQYGAFAPVAVQNAVAAAQQAIFDVTTKVGKTIFQASLANSIADPLNTILDGFNNGSAGQQECTQ